MSHTTRAETNLRRDRAAGTEGRRRKRLTRRALLWSSRIAESQRELRQPEQLLMNPCSFVYHV